MSDYILGGPIPFRPDFTRATCSKCGIPVYFTSPEAPALLAAGVLPLCGPCALRTAATRPADDPLDLEWLSRSE